MAKEIVIGIFLGFCLTFFLLGIALFLVDLGKSLRKKKNEKGFIFIDLLAVIIISAIVLMEVLVAINSKKMIEEGKSQTDSIDCKMQRQDKNTFIIDCTERR